MPVEVDDIREQHGDILLGKLRQVPRLEIVAQKELGFLGCQETPQQVLDRFLLADLVQQVDTLQGQRRLVADRHHQLHIAVVKGARIGLGLDEAQQGDGLISA